MSSSLKVLLTSSMMSKLFSGNHQHPPSSLLLKSSGGHLSTLRKDGHNSSDADNSAKPRFDFDVSDFFSFGSPLGMLLAYRKVQVLNFRPTLLMYSLKNNHCSNPSIACPFQGRTFNKCTIFSIQRIPWHVALNLCCRRHFPEYLQSTFPDTKNTPWATALVIP